MIKLNNILQCKYIYILILLITFAYSYFYVKNELHKPFYKGNEINFTGIINGIKIDGNHLKVELIEKDKMIMNYYFNDKKEMLQFKNNYQIGDYIKVKGELIIPSNNTVFNLFNYRNHLLSKKTYWILKAKLITKINKRPKFIYMLKRKIITRIESAPKSSHYIKNFVIGDIGNIDENILSSYQKNGLNHLLSLSGSHLSLFSLIIMSLAKKTFKKETVQDLFTIVVLIIYLLLANYPPSLIRATLMYILLKINKIKNLNISTLNCFIIVLSILLFINPYYIYHLGFVFSFTISFFLILFKDLINNFNNYIMKMFIISLISFLVSIPILINNFFEINLLIPFINIIFIPIFISILFPLSLIVLILPKLDNFLYFLITITEKFSAIISKVNNFVLIFPKISITLILIYYILIYYVLKSIMNKKHYKCIYVFIALICFYNIPFLKKDPVITFFDVGQGDSSLIELPKNTGNILIDTGGIVNYNNESWKMKQSVYSIAEYKIIPYLKSRGIRKLDYLVLTHGHEDHLGEAINIINEIKVKNVIFNSASNNELENNIIDYLIDKKIPIYFYNQNKLMLNDYDFHFINKKNTLNENEDSLIIYTKINNVNILLTGDAGKISEQFLINSYNLPKMDILKVGHHGSKYSTSEEFIKVIKPKYAIISAGLNNRFNHPHQEVIDVLKKFNVNYFETSKHGSVRFILKNEIVIETCF